MTAIVTDVRCYLEGIVLSATSQTEKTSPHDFTFLGNLKKTINKENRNRLTDTENRLMVAKWERIWRLGEKGERIDKYRLVVTKQSWGCKVQHKE